MKAPITSTRFSPPLPLLQGERIEVRGSKTARELKLQTLTLPSPLERERRLNRPMQVRGVKPDPLDETADHSIPG